MYSEQAVFFLHQNIIRPHSFHAGDPRRKAGDSGYIQRSRLCDIRQKIRHILFLGIAARSSVKKGFRTAAAEQNPRSLGAVKALMTGHCDKTGTAFPQGHRQHPCRLSSVDDQRDSP